MRFAGVLPLVPAHDHGFRYRVGGRWPTGIGGGQKALAFVLFLLPFLCLLLSAFFYFLLPFLCLLLSAFSFVIFLASLPFFSPSLFLLRFFVASIAEEPGH